MGYLKYVRAAWKKPSETIAPEMRARYLQWRREGTTVRVDHPTRPDRARSLGYKAKQGFVVVRQKLEVTKSKRERMAGGRRPKTKRMKKVLSENYQQIAEKRANKEYTNMEVLNSYWVGSDAKHYWYEVILVDPASPSIQADKDTNWICYKQHTKRVTRGLTSAARKSRGLRRKGVGAEKIRPSNRANSRLSK